MRSELHTLAGARTTVSQTPTRTGESVADSTIRETFAADLAPLTDEQRDALVRALDSSRLEHGMPSREHVRFQVRAVLEGWDDATYTRNMLAHIQQG